MYNYTFADPPIDRSDPSWASAWWIGYVIVALALLLLSFPLMMFPSQIKSDKASHDNPIVKSEKKKTQLDELRSYQNQGMADVIAGAKG